MPLHVLYSPAHLDFVRGADGKPITTEKPSPTRADVADVITAHHAAVPADLRAKAPEAPHGSHFMQVTDEDDSTVFQPNSPAVKRGEPTIVRRGEHAVRLFPLIRK
jgi:hypothetical protein